MTALLPIGPPVSRPRSVWVSGVNGWYSANQRSPAGIEAVGTNPLPKNGSSIRNMGVLLAVSTVLAAMPMATHSQGSANAAIATTPAAASQASGAGAGREPMGRAEGGSTGQLGGRRV